MTVPTHLRDVAEAAMQHVLTETTNVLWEVALDPAKRTSSPSMVWCPSRERLTESQKRPGPHSIGTILAGFTVTVYGADVATTETLRVQLLRALLLTLGPQPFRGDFAGDWVRGGIEAGGAAYVLSGAYALDVPRAPTPPATTTPTSVTIDTTRSTVGDGLVDAGEGTT